MTSTLATTLATAADAAERAADKQELTIFDLVERQKPEIARALPAGMTADRFTRLLVTALKANPQLQQCTAFSLLGAAMLSAQLGLEPGPLGHAYLVPFRNRKTGQFEVTFIVGYRGLLDLAHRSGKIESIVAREVRERDHFEFEFGTDDRLVHRPALADRGESIAYYAVARLVSGGTVVHVMGRDDIERHRARSRAADSGPWVTDYDAMARKTVIRAMSPYLPLSIDAARAIANDDVVTTTIDDDLADRTPPLDDVLDVDGEEISRAAHVDVPSTGGSARAGGSADGAESAPGGEGGAGEAPVPSATADATETTELVNAEGAQTIARWCIDAGIPESQRPAFLWAFSGGRYRSAKHVPTGDLPEIRATLQRVHAGTLVLQMNPDGGGGPVLASAAGDSGGITEPAETPAAPAGVHWREQLGRVRGVGQAKLLRQARAIAEQHQLELPKSLDEITDPTVTAELQAWLDAHAGAEA